MSAARSLPPLASPADIVLRQVEDAAVWAEAARYDDTTAEQCALLTVAWEALVRARSAILRALALDVDGGPAVSPEAAYRFHPADLAVMVGREPTEAERTAPGRDSYYLAYLDDGGCEPDEALRLARRDMTATVVRLICSRLSRSPDWFWRARGKA